MGFAGIYSSRLVLLHHVVLGWYIKLFVKESHSARPYGGSKTPRILLQSSLYLLPGGCTFENPDSRICTRTSSVSCAYSCSCWRLTAPFVAIYLGTLRIPDENRAPVSLEYHSLDRRVYEVSLILHPNLSLPMTRKKHAHRISPVEG